MRPSRVIGTIYGTCFLSASPAIICTEYGPDVSVPDILFNIFSHSSAHASFFAARTTFTLIHRTKPRTNMAMAIPTDPLLLVIVSSSLLSSRRISPVMPDSACDHVEDKTTNGLLPQNVSNDVEGKTEPPQVSISSSDAKESVPSRPPSMLRKISSSSYHVNSMIDSLKKEKASLRVKLKNLKDEISTKSVANLQERFGSLAPPATPEPFDKKNSSLYLIVSFGKIRNLKEYFQRLKIVPVEKSMGFLRLAVRTRSKGKRRWEPLMKTTTEERPLFDMVDADKVFRVGGVDEDSGSTTTNKEIECDEIELKGMVLGSIDSVASKAAVGSFRVVFPCRENMSDEMWRSLNEGQEISFFADVSMNSTSEENITKSSPSMTSRNAQHVSDMNVSEGGIDMYAAKYSDRVILPIYFHMFDPDDYVSKLLWFHAQYDDRTDHSIRYRDAMKRHHDEIREAQEEVHAKEMTAFEEEEFEKRRQLAEAHAELDDDITMLSSERDEIVRSSLAQLREEKETYEDEWAKWSAANREAVEKTRQRHREEQEEVMDAVCRREEDFLHELESLEQKQEEDFEHAHVLQKEELEHEMMHLTHIFRGELEHLRMQQSETESRVIGDLESDFEQEMTTLRKEEVRRENDDVEARVDMWTRKSYAKSVAECASVIGTELQQQFESKNDASKELAKETRELQLEEVRLIKNRQDALEIEHEAQLRRHLDRVHALNVKFENEIGVVQSEAREDTIFHQEAMSRIRERNGAMSRLEELMTLERDFERRLEEKERQELIHVGLRARSEVQSSLRIFTKSFQEHLQEEWRELGMRTSASIESARMIGCSLRDIKDHQDRISDERVLDEDTTRLTHAGLYSSSSPQLKSQSPSRVHMTDAAISHNKQTSLGSRPRGERKDTQQSPAMKRWLNSHRSR